MITARTASAFFAFLAFVYLLSLTARTAPTIPEISDSQNTSPHSHPSNLVGVHVSTNDGTKFIYQRPIHTPSLGLIIFFHGCRHAAEDFFPPSPTCTSCVGLPEEMRMATLSLARGFSVIALSSTGSASAKPAASISSKCWKLDAVGGKGVDYDRVQSALQYARQHHLYTESSPLFVVGASSGGRFASSLFLKFPVSAVNSIISPSILQLQQRDDETPVFPAHFFVHMPARDQRTAKAVEKDVQIFQSKGIPSKHIEVHPFPVTSSVLLERLPHWDETLAKEVIKALKDKKFLDQDGMVTEDPRRSLWRTAVDHLKDRMKDSLVLDMSPFLEQLCRAWAHHEITAAHFEEVLDFFEVNKDRAASVSS